MIKVLNLKESVLINLNYDKTEFLTKLKEIIDYDEGILKDELYHSDKKYIGKIDSENFTLRKKRRFMNPRMISSSANGKIVEFKDQISLEIEVNGTDEIANLALIAGPIFFLCFTIGIIVKETYPLLIIIIPISILFLILPRIKIKKDLSKFKSELVNELNKL